MELAFFKELAIGGPGLGVDVGVLDGGHAFAVELFDDAEDALFFLGEGGGGDEAGDHLHGGFLEDARGLSLGVLIDGAGGWGLRAGGDVGEAEGGGVGYAVVAGGVEEPDGVGGGDVVEVGGVEVAGLGELALVPAVALEPLAGVQGLDAFGDASPHLDDGGGVGKVDVEDLVHAAAGEVAVAVDEAGGGGASVEVDDAGAGADEGLDGGVRPDAKDLAARGWRAPGLRCRRDRR